MSRFSVSLQSKTGSLVPVDIACTKTELVFFHNGSSFDTIAYSVMNKIVPSSTRSKRPGPVEGVDISYNSPNGIKDVRFLCASVQEADRIRLSMIEIAEIALANTLPMRPDLNRISPAPGSASAGSVTAASTLATTPMATPSIWRPVEATTSAAEDAAAEAPASLFRPRIVAPPAIRATTVNDEEEEEDSEEEDDLDFMAIAGPGERPFMPQPTQQQAYQQQQVVDDDDEDEEEEVVERFDPTPFETQFEPPQFVDTATTTTTTTTPILPDPIPQATWEPPNLPPQRRSVDPLPSLLDEDDFFAPSSFPPPPPPPQPTSPPPTPPPTTTNPALTPLGDPLFPRDGDLSVPMHLSSKPLDLKSLEPVRALLQLPSIPQGHTARRAALSVEDAKRIVFLEDVVRRLSDQLSRLQGLPSATAAAAASASNPSAAADHDSSSSSSFLPVPPWALDASQLPPLLEAYDEVIREQQTALRESSLKYTQLEEQMTALQREHQQLHASLEKTVDATASALLAAPSTRVERQAGPGVSQLVERSELLTQENDLLSQQVRSLEVEVQRLNRELDAREVQHRVVTREANEMAKTKHALSSALTKIKLLKDRELNLESELDGMRTELERRKDVDSLLDECEHQLAALRADNESLRSGAANAEGAAASLSAELSSLQQHLDAVVQDRDRLEKESSRLRSGVDGMQARLLDYQRREGDIAKYQRETTEVFSEATSLKRTLEARELALKNESDAIRQQLLEESARFAERVRDEVARRTRELEFGSNQASQQQHEAVSQALTLRLQLERSERERETLIEQLRQLKLHATSLGVDVDAQGGASSMLLTLKAENASLEDVNEDLRHELRKLEAAHEQTLRDLAKLRDQLHLTSGTMQRRVLDAEREAAEGVTELQRLELEVTELKRTVQANQDAMRNQDEAWRSRLETLRVEKEGQVRRLVERLDASDEARRKLSAESEGLLAARHAVTEQWKHEAQASADKIRALLAHARDLEQKRMDAIEALESKLSALGAERSSLAQDVAALKGARNEAEARLADVRQKCTEAERRMRQLEHEAESHLEERREALSRLDRASLDVARAERERDVVQYKCDMAEKQIKALEDRLRAVVTDKDMGGRIHMRNKQAGAGGLGSSRRRRVIVSDDENDGDNFAAQAMSPPPIRTRAARV